MTKAYQNIDRYEIGDPYPLILKAAKGFITKGRNSPLRSLVVPLRGISACKSDQFPCSFYSYH